MTPFEIIRASVQGKPCWRAWRGFQSALFFEFGERDQAGRRGEYTIGMVGCPWQVFENDNLLFNSKSEYSEMDKLQKRFNNQSLVDILIDSQQHEASILFSDDLKIQAYLNEEDDEWHILTPTEECVFTRSSITISPRVD